MSRGCRMEEGTVVQVRISKLDGSYGVTIDTGEGVVLEPEYYQPRTAEEVGRIVQLWLEGLEP